jgi:hypothetical protein
VGQRRFRHYFLIMAALEWEDIVRVADFLAGPI